MSWELDLPSPWFPGWREEGGYDYRCCRPVWDCCDYQSDFYDDWRRIEKNLWSEIKKRRAGNGPWGRGHEKGDFLSVGVGKS